MESVIPFLQNKNPQPFLRGWYWMEPRASYHGPSLLPSILGKFNFLTLPLFAFSREVISNYLLVACCGLLCPPKVLVLET